MRLSLKGMAKAALESYVGLKAIKGLTSAALVAGAGYGMYRIYRRLTEE